jgi:hypothetical protein
MHQTKYMKFNRRAAIALSASAFSILAAAALIIFLVSARGTIGLLRWNQKYLSVLFGIGAAGALPAAASLALVGIGRRREGKAALVAGWVCSALAALAGIGFAAALFAVMALGSSSPVKEPRLNLLTREQVDSWSLLSRRPVFAFSSDAHFGGDGAAPQATAAIIRLIDSKSYNAFFVLGDTVEMGIIDADIEAAYGAFSEERRVPLSFLMGNHDPLIGAAPRFKKIFGIPAPSARIDSAGLHIIALDLPWGTEEWNASKSRKLKAELEAIPAEDAIIVVSHCFFWSSGYRDPSSGKDWFDHAETTKEIASILENGKVDLVVSGHNHYLEYLENGDTGYAVVGALGGKPDPEPVHVSPYSVWFSQGLFGYLEAEVADDEISLRFIDEKGNALFEKRRPVNR